MNKFLHATIVATIQMNDVDLKRRAGMDVYTVKDAAGKELMKIENGYDLGLYRLSVNDADVIRAEWREGMPESQEMKTFTNLLQMCIKRVDELSSVKKARDMINGGDMKKDMSAADHRALEFLSGALER